jgi:predicted exporter
VSGFFLKDSIHISTNLLSLFASKESLERFKVADNLGYSKEIFVTIKGFSKESKRDIKKIAKELQNLKEIESVTYSLSPTKKLQEYYRKNYTLLADFNSSTLTQKEVKEQLQKLYDAQLNSFFYTPINKNDPLSLFSLSSLKNIKNAHRGNYMTLGEYGYLIRVRSSVSASDMNKAKELYNKLQKIFKVYPNVVAFAPFFYTVENSSAIESDVKSIVILSTILLLLLYYLLIKNIKLLTQTVVALASSMLFATLVTTTLFDNFNILSLAFGMSLSAVSIDYLLHYYFHNFYEQKRGVDKNVFYGFLTTISAFAIFSFIPIPLISQISIFSLLSLSFAYIIFTFVFPYIEIKPYKEESKEIGVTKFSLSSEVIFFFSIALFLYTAINFKLDTNLRNLDYQNITLRASENLFKSANTTNLSPVIVEAKDAKELIENLTKLKESAPSTLSLASFVLSPKECKKRVEHLKKYDFTTLNKMINKEATSVGFREGFFKDAYSSLEELPSCELPPLDIFETLSLSYYEDNDRVYSIALVEDTKSVERFAFVKSLDMKAIFAHSTSEMYSSLVLFGSMVLSIIMLLLFVSVKKNFLFALNYILFPSALSLAVITTFESVNIMHLFSLIILVAIGIDYGIYMSNSDKQTVTMRAITYSLLSTFGAFGVLVFSSIVALNSIGMVITLGCGAIFILIKVMR